MARNPSLGRLLQATVLVTIAALSPLSAVEFTVNSLSDVRDFDPGDGICSIKNPLLVPNRCTLRAAVEEANALPTPDSIVLLSGRHALTIPGIGEDGSAEGDLDITDDVTIRGEGVDLSIVDAAGLDRVFHLKGDIVVTLEQLTVTGGRALDASAYPAGMGGGVLVADGAFLRLFRARVADNRALAGGGIGGWALNEIEIVSSEVTRNQIQLGSGYMSFGGALHVENPAVGIVEILYSTISNNGCLTLTGAACFGGLTLGHQCLDNPGAGLIMRNSTVSGNEGVGLWLGACNGIIENSTFYGNSGYGISIVDSGVPAHPVTARNTIFAANGIQDCNLVVGGWDFEFGHNLSSDDTCDLSAVVSDKINTDPELYPLGYHAPTPPASAPTHHPRWDAPVVDTGGILASVTDDQEGFPRPLDGNKNNIASYDMGSIEVLPCVAEVDLVVAHVTLTTGIRRACNTLTVGPGVEVNGSIIFSARDSVRIGNGFSVTAGSQVKVEVSRAAGIPI